MIADKRMPLGYARRKQLSKSFVIPSWINNYLHNTVHVTRNVATGTLSKNLFQANQNKT